MQQEERAAAGRGAGGAGAAGRGARRHHCAAPGGGATQQDHTGTFHLDTTPLDGVSYELTHDGKVLRYFFSKHL